VPFPFTVELKRKKESFWSTNPAIGRAAIVSLLSLKRNFVLPQFEDLRWRRKYKKEEFCEGINT
jgi:hypothetical protein